MAINVWKNQQKITLPTTNRNDVRNDLPIILIILAIVLLAVTILIWRIFWYRRYALSERRERQDALLLAQARRAAARRAIEESDEQAQAFAEEALEQFDAMSVHSESLCVVCMDVLDTKEGNVLAAPCMHVLHENCWRGWLAKDVKRACPICRASVIIEQSTTDKKEEGEAETVTENLNESSNNDSPRIQAPDPAPLPTSNRPLQRWREQSRHLSLLSQQRGRADDEESQLGYDYNQRRHLSLIIFDGNEDLEDFTVSNGILSLMRVRDGPSSNSRTDVNQRRDRLLTASANINLLGSMDPNNSTNGSVHDDVNEIQQEQR